MKITKRILPTVLILALGFFALQAQRNNERPPIDPEKMAEKQTTRMVEKLSLDEKQVEQVKAINLKYAQQQKAAKEKEKAERETKKAERQKAQEAKMAELKKVLTTEQFAKLEQAQEKRGARKGSRKGSPRSTKGKHQNLDPEKRSEIQTTKMVEKLGLNDEQTKSLQQTNLDFAKKRQALRAENKEMRQTNKEAMEKLNEEQKMAIGKILTPEQMKQWEEMEPERGRRHHREKNVDDGRM